MLQTFRRSLAVYPFAGIAERVTAERLYLMAISAAVLLGAGVRAWFTLRFSFPLNDGGMFFQMARDLQADHFALPATTSYNGGDIPFAYPPLGLYAAALIDTLTPLSLVQVFRLLPLLTSVAAIVAFAWLARAVLVDRLRVIAAVFAFALIPRSFTWMIMGGGVTRSFGLLFAILALYQLRTMYSTGSTRRALLAGLLCALTVLSHLETGWFLAFSAALGWVAWGRSRRGVEVTGLVAACTLVLTAPWWLTVVVQHGTGPLLDAGGSGGTVFSVPDPWDFTITSLARPISTNEPFFPLIGALGLLGAFWTVVHGKLRILPAWWAITILLDVRASATFTTLPVALLAAVGVVEVLLPVLERAAGHAGARRLPLGLGRYEWSALAVGACFLYFATGAAVDSRVGYGEGSLLRSVSTSQRAAMAWIDANTPSDAVFFVVPQAPWQVDRTTEWFPALAGRESVTTVQGSEWLPDGAFDRRIWAHDAAWNCAGQDSLCLDSWLFTQRADFNYVYVPAYGWASCCSSLLESLQLDHQFVQVYEGPGGNVFEWRRPRFGPFEAP